MSVVEEKEPLLTPVYKSIKAGEFKDFPVGDGIHEGNKQIMKLGGGGYTTKIFYGETGKKQPLVRQIFADKDGFIERSAHFNSNEEIQIDISQGKDTGFVWTRDFGNKGRNVIDDKFELNGKEIEPKVRSDGTRFIFGSKGNFLFNETKNADGGVAQELFRKNETIQRTVFLSEDRKHVLDDAHIRNDGKVDWNKEHYSDGALKNHKYFCDEGEILREALHNRNGADLEEQRLYYKGTGEPKQFITYNNSVDVGVNTFYRPDGNTYRRRPGGENSLGDIKFRKISETGNEYWTKYVSVESLSEKSINR